ncbi:helix-turn-helix domain-containing protein [Bacillus cereus]|uniref:helix-turn-helix domain-containing protein n=1 Tax=Bacillus cereus TaxID=1396 RepID=UPI000B4ABD07|nr:helix-turn-helix transcriptional regulator [Bacillus cereus]
MNITAKRVHLVRMNKKMTMEVLANKVNKSKSTISQIESGKIMPSRQLIGELSKALETSVDYLLGISNGEDVVFERNNDVVTFNMSKLKESGMLSETEYNILDLIIRKLN